MATVGAAARALFSETGPIEEGRLPFPVVGAKALTKWSGHSLTDILQRRSDASKGSFAGVDDPVVLPTEIPALRLQALDDADNNHPVLSGLLTVLEQIVFRGQLVAVLRIGTRVIPASPEFTRTINACLLPVVRAMFRPLVKGGFTPYRAGWVRGEVVCAALPVRAYRHTLNLHESGKYTMSASMDMSRAGATAVGNRTAGTATTGREWRGGACKRPDAAGPDSPTELPVRTWIVSPPEDVSGAIQTGVAACLRSMRMYARLENIALAVATRAAHPRVATEGIAAAGSIALGSDGLGARDAVQAASSELATRAALEVRMAQQEREIVELEESVHAAKHAPRVIATDASGAEITKSGHLVGLGHGAVDVLTGNKWGDTETPGEWKRDWVRAGVGRRVVALPVPRAISVTAEARDLDERLAASLGMPLAVLISTRAASVATVQWALLDSTCESWALEMGRVASALYASLWGTRDAQAVAYEGMLRRLGSRGSGSVVPSARSADGRLAARLGALQRRAVPALAVEETMPTIKAAQSATIAAVATSHEDTTFVAASIAILQAMADLRAECAQGEMPEVEIRLASTLRPAAYWEIQQRGGFPTAASKLYLAQAYGVDPDSVCAPPVPGAAAHARIPENILGRGAKRAREDRGAQPDTGDASTPPHGRGDDIGDARSTTRATKRARGGAEGGAE